MPDSDHETYATRATLLARLKDWEDGPSWQEFFETHWQMIFGVARKCGLSKEEAQDVVQETMLSVAKHMPGFNYDRTQGSFKAWLLSLTHWRIRDQFRKRSPFTRPQVGEDAEDAAAKQEDLEEIVDESGSDRELDRIWEEEWRRNLLQIAARRVKVFLVPQSYQIFDFSVNKGWDSERIAAAFRISVGQVYQAKHRVGRLIRKEIEQLERDLDRNGVPMPSSIQGADDLVAEGIEGSSEQG